MHNVEIKAKIDDPKDIIKCLEEMNVAQSATIKQHDTFFKVIDGRLKLREFEDGSGELIYYRRFDVVGPKVCNYEKVSLGPDETAGIKRVLTGSNGCVGIVKKVRKLYMIDQTRVHVDDVEGLGHFMELEVVMKDDECPEVADAIVKDLMNKLGVQSQNLVGPAYVDLLSIKSQSTS